MQQKDLLRRRLGMLEPVRLLLHMSSGQLGAYARTPLRDSGAAKGILGHFLRPATVLWGLRFQSLPELYKEEIACVVGLFFPLYNQERSPQTLTE